MKRYGHGDRILILIFEHIFNQLIAHVQHIGYVFSAHLLGVGLLLFHARNRPTVVYTQQFTRLIIHANNVVVHVDIFYTHTDQRNDLIFNATRIERVVAICELNNLAHIVADSHIVFNLKIFQTFDQTTLNISRLRSFHSGINQTDTTTHRMEE